MRVVAGDDSGTAPLSEAQLGPRELKLAFLTWNVGEKCPSAREFKAMMDKHVGSDTDILVVATQENEYIVQGKTSVSAIFHRECGTGVRLPGFSAKFSCACGPAARHYFDRVEHFEMMVLDCLNTGPSSSTAEDYWNVPAGGHSVIGQLRLTVFLCAVRPPVITFAIVQAASFCAETSELSIRIRRSLVRKPPSRTH